MLTISPTLTYKEVIIRLFCALAVGFIIGMERERNHHIAGMRTHMLVALGSCVAMMTNVILFNTYSAFGATPDTGRLGAAVISGIGFIGAGTIVHDKFSTKGLTTAAGILTVACLGLASGAGFWQVAIAGSLLALVILKILAKVQRKVFGMKIPEANLVIECEDVEGVMNLLGDITVKNKFKISNIKINGADGIKTLTMRVVFNGVHQKQNMMDTISSMSSNGLIKNVSIDYDLD